MESATRDISNIFSAKQRAFSVSSKVVGSLCNLNCDYCFYTEKQSNRFMNFEVLETYIRQYIESQSTAIVSFLWQGGEPTLAGISFFEKVIEFQLKYKAEKSIENTIQTNGTLLNDEWCAFLKEHNFVVALSIDGPEHIHNYYRKDSQQNGSFEAVMQGVSYLHKHEVDFTTISVIGKYQSEYALEIYNFLKEIGITFMQFVPLVERIAVDSKGERKHVSHSQYIGPTILADYSIESETWGVFLNTIFREWSTRDVGKHFIQIFESTLASHMGLYSSVCLFSKTCGNAAIIESNGSMYSCDYYVFEEFYIGNIFQNSIAEIMSTPDQKVFGDIKYASLPNDCLECEYVRLCYGECPKKRFNTTANGEKGLNYLCKGYFNFFKESEAVFTQMRHQIQQQSIRAKKHE